MKDNWERSASTMITSNTVFVLGAGASAHLGFPTSQELIDRIVSELAKGSLLCRTLSCLDHEMSRIDHLKHVLSTSDLNTPDFIIASNPELQTIGAQAIAWTIGIYEDPAALSNSNPNDPFYRYIWNQMYAVDVEKFTENNVRVINFNYDRSLEQYLIDQLVNTYGITHERAYDIRSHSALMLPVHGQIGALPPTEREPARRYKTTWFSDSSRLPDDELDDFRKAASQIKIATQTNITDDEFTKAQIWLAEAECVIFVGFAFHSMNTHNLKLIETLCDPTRVFICTYRMGFGEIASGMSFFTKMSHLNGNREYAKSAMHRIRIGNPEHKATEFMRTTVWLDTSATEARYARDLMYQ